MNQARNLQQKKFLKKSKGYSLKSRLSPTQRLGLAKKIRSARRYDRNRRYNVSRYLSGYEHVLLFNIPKKVEEIFKRKGSAVSLLDIGTGNKNAMNELAQKVGKNIDISTIGVSLLQSEKNNIRQMIRAFENAKIQKKFDLIVSVGGTPYLTVFPFVVQKICNLLTVGGEARISINPKKIAIAAAVEKELKKQGLFANIEVRTYLEETSEEYDSAVMIIKRLNKKPANLESLIKQELQKPITDNIEATRMELG